MGTRGVLVSVFLLSLVVSWSLVVLAQYDEDWGSRDPGFPGGRSEPGGSGEGDWRGSGQGGWKGRGEGDRRGSGQGDRRGSGSSEGDWRGSSEGGWKGRGEGDRRGSGEGGRDPGFPGGREEGGGGRGPEYGGRGEQGRDPGFPGGREEGGGGQVPEYGGEGGPWGPEYGGEGGPWGPEYGGGGGEEGGSGKREGEGSFLLQESKPVVQTEAGYMRVVGGAAAAGGSGRTMIKTGTLEIGFITMEPRSLFIPQYLDSNLILFVRRGGARVGHIYDDDLVEKDLKTGDIYRIGAGSTFYIINSAQGQRVHIVCSIDTSEGLGWNSFQSFFVAGGTYPRSILSGFDPLTLSTAFNVSQAEMGSMLTRQQRGPIVFLTETHSPSVLAKYMRRTLILNRMALPKEDEVYEAEWPFKKLFNSIFGGNDNKKDKDKKGSKRVGKDKGPDSYNIYDRKADFSNDYGWSIALDESDYKPLKEDDIGVFLVNLTAGSMMAPHINPRATEYGIVLKGAGTIQIVYPDGSLAMNAKVNVGDVFWIPRYFPFCQIASRTGPFEFFGFTTSARNNKPQFLAGANSLLQTLRGPEVAAAFGLTEEQLKTITDAQRESVILPSAAVSPPEEIPSGPGAAEEEEQVVPPAKKIPSFSDM